VLSVKIAGIEVSVIDKARREGIGYLNLNHRQNSTRLPFPAQYCAFRAGHL
jgi:hypothetical protein